MTSGRVTDAELDSIDIPGAHPLLHRMVVELRDCRQQRESDRLYISKLWKRKDELRAERDQALAQREEARTPLQGLAMRQAVEAKEQAEAQVKVLTEENEQLRAQAGLPADLLAVLKNQGIVVERDSDVWNLIAEWRNAPSNTGSADRTENT
jgi:hypothetical protein